jgi:hypothetical protein
MVQVIEFVNRSHFFKSILMELWNRELYEQLFGKFNEDLTIFNVLDRFQFLFFNE